MRILFVTASSGSHGGGEIYLLYLAQGLRALGHDVALWASDHRRMDALAKGFAAHGAVMRAPYVNLYDRWHRGLLSRPASRRVQAAWTTQWLSFAPDVVHFNKQCLEDGLDLLGAAARLPVPHLAMVHITQSASWLGARLGRLRDRAARRHLSNYPGTLVTSPEFRVRDLTAFLPGFEQIEMIYNGSPSSDSPPSPRERAELRRREKIAEGDFAIVATGRLEAQKRPLDFLRQIRRMRDAGLRVTGRWLGDGRLLEAWNAEVARLGLGDIIRRDNWREDVSAILPAFDLFLHPARFEGLPFALLEAMHAGLPCVVSREVATDLPPGFDGIVRSFDPEEDWSSLLSDEKALVLMGQRALALARERHSIKSMAAAYEHLYRRLSATLTGRDVVGRAADPAHASSAT